MCVTECRRLRFQCVIDLKHNQLVIGTTGTRTSFLPESDLPEHARLNRPASTSAADDAMLAEAMAKSASEGEWALFIAGVLNQGYQYPQGVPRVP